MNPITSNRVAACSLAAVLSLCSTASAIQHSLTIDGTNAIFLAGRTDIVIPAANLPWNSPAGSFLIRHGGPTPEEALETLPPFISVIGGDVIKVADPVVGGIDFFNGTTGFFGPGGNGLDGSNLTSLGGISGYKGPQGPLVGVFLDASIPNGAAPSTLDFTPTGLGTDFLSLNPGLGQVFYIGDGVTSGAVFQQFVAPAGATRLFLGIPDGFGFVGGPGAYDDNNGSYRVNIGVNETPTTSVPDGGASVVLLGLSLAGMAGAARCAGRKPELS